MNKYNLYVLDYGSTLVFADYFDTCDGSFYFYKNAPQGVDGNTLVSVYPISRTMIQSIDYNYNSK